MKDSIDIAQPSINPSSVYRKSCDSDLSCSSEMTAGNASPSFGDTGCARG
jgi:hypothetical protein